MNACSHHDSSPEKLRDISKWGRRFFYPSLGMMIHARVRTCLVMLRVIGPGDAGWWWRDDLCGNIKCVSDSVLSSPHQHSNAQRSALPHGGVVLLPLTVQLSTLSWNIRKKSNEIINCNYTNFISNICCAICNGCRLLWRPIFCHCIGLFFYFPLCPQRLKSKANTATDIYW